MSFTKDELTNESIRSLVGLFTKLDRQIRLSWQNNANIANTYVLEKEQEEIIAEIERRICSQK